MDDQRHLVLIGMMGVGKSSVGRRLALRLGRQFLDTDKMVEEEAGCTVADIFAAEGEAGLPGAGGGGRPQGAGLRTPTP